MSQSALLALRNILDLASRRNAIAAGRVNLRQASVDQLPPDALGGSPS